MTSLRSFFHFRQNWSYFENREVVIGGTHTESGFLASDETFDVHVNGLCGVHSSGCFDASGRSQVSGDQTLSLQSES